MKQPDSGVNPQQPDEIQPEELKQRQELSPEELSEQEAADLPEREAMSLVNANVAAPVNLAAALNVLSDGSVAVANAQQTAPVNQST